MGVRTGLRVGVRVGMEVGLGMVDGGWWFVKCFSISSHSTQYFYPLKTVFFQECFLFTFLNDVKGEKL